MSRHIAQQYNLNLAPVKKPKYSFSQLERAKCGQRFLYSKTEPKSEKTYNLCAGTMLDTAFNAYYENNMHLKESHEERMEFARAALELHLRENPEYFELPWSKKAGDVRSSPENFVSWLFDKGALEMVCRQDRGPVEVQKCVELELPRYSIIGYIDCLELNTNTVVDVKCVTGWGDTTLLKYALRPQVLLYRMLLRDTKGVATSGRYELLLCRKSPKLELVDDPTMDFMEAKLISDFDIHHKMCVEKTYTRNPEHCFDFNRTCEHLVKCWPQLAHLVTKPEAVAP